MITRTNKIGIFLILLSLSVENKTFLNYTFAGIGPGDIGVLCGLACLFWGNHKFSYNMNKVQKYTFIMLSGGAIVLAFSIIEGYQFNYMVADVRNYIFLVAAYILFRDTDGAKEYVQRVIPWLALVNCLVFLSQANYFVGSFVREIYTPLWVSVLAVGCILLGKTPITPIKYAIVLISIISIIISETRSYIFPVVIITVCYLFIAVREKRLGSVIAVLSVVVLAYWYFKNLGMIEKISKRMNGSFGAESTMWLRFENAFIQLKKMNFRQWITGRGFGERILVFQYDGSLRETSDLEMVCFNQIIEFGLPLFIYNFFYSVVNAYKGFRVSRSYVFLISTLGIMMGGFVSGLAGSWGSIIVGMLMGMLGHESKRLFRNRNMQQDVVTAVRYKCVVKNE